MTRPSLRSLLGVASLAIFSLFIAPLSASATPQTTILDGSSNAASTIAAGDQLAVTLDGPILTVGQTTQRLTSMWSPSSLQLKTSSITYPVGWGLEYTVDGTTWTGTAPSNLATVVGIRASGSVNATSANVFATTSTGSNVVVTSSFTGQAGGDGLNLIFAGDRVFNIWHHAASLNIDCHLVATGAACYSPAVKQFGGSTYSTGNASQGYWYAAENKLYAQTSKGSGAAQRVGMTCVDYSNRSAPALCATPWVELGEGVGNDNGTSAQIGNKIYIPNAKTWKMMCFDMSTGAACSNSGTFTLPNNGIGSATLFGRATALAGKIYFSTYGFIGCYDPATNNYCDTSTVNTGRLATTSNASQYPLFPVRNASGQVTAMCFFPTQQCIDPATGNEIFASVSPNVSMIPSLLATWMSAHAIPGWVTNNAGMWAEQSNKIYFEVGPSSTATADVYCFDYTAGTPCSGFGTGGTATGVGAQIYFIQNDPTVPNCMWTIGNTGLITTFNATTGASGCSLAHPMADIAYTSSVPRMSCTDGGRVTAWDSLTVDLATSGIAMADVRVTVLDSNGQPITNFVDLTPNGSGVVDLSSMTTSASGTHPTFRLANWTTAGAGTVSALQGTVKYTATNPQLCFTMLAKQQCAGVTPSGSDTTVPNGLMQTTVLSTPVSGTAQDQVQNITLTGTNTSATCAPVIGVFDVATPSAPATPTVASPAGNLAHTGQNPYQLLAITLAGLMSISIGAGFMHLAAKRRSKS